MLNLLLNPINWSTFGWVVLIVTILAVVFGLLIVLISKVCAVKENEKANAVTIETTFFIFLKKRLAK